MDIIRKNERYRVLQNPQVRHYSGAADSEIITKEHLEKAKEHVAADTLFAAPTEFFDDALVILGTELNLELEMLPYQKLNVTTSKRKHGWLTRMRIRQLHPLDHELWKHCRSRFQALMRQYHKD